MNNISLSAVLNKNQVASDAPWLIALKIEAVDPNTRQVVDTIHIVHNDEDITLAGQLYVASAFQINIQESENELPTISVSIVDITQTIMRYLEEYKGANGSHITMYVFPATSTVIERAEVDYTFDVISASADTENYTATWQLGAENPLTLPVPARKQMRDRCQWRYKSGDCGYTGGIATCDLSLDGPNGCTAHNNVEHFGGYPGINVRNV